MRNYAMIFGLMLILGLSVAVPAEDVPETAFDESESPAYESTPRFTILVPQVAALAARTMTCVSPLGYGRLTKHSAFCPEHRIRPHSTSDSLTILDHSFRC